jgi:hypothetical protein
VIEDLAASTTEVSRSAIRRHGLVLSMILAAAEQDGRIARNACDGVRLPTEEAPTTGLTTTQ